MSTMIDHSINFDVSYCIHLEAYANNSIQYNEKGEWIRSEDMPDGKFRKLTIDIDSIFNIYDFNDEQMSDVRKRMEIHADYKSKEKSIIYCKLPSLSDFNTFVQQNEYCNKSVLGYVVVPYNVEELKYDIAQLKDRKELIYFDLDLIRKKYT